MILRPLARASITKFIDHVGSAHPDAEAETVRSPALYSVVYFYAQSIKMLNTVYPLVIDVKAIPTQQLPDVPIAFKRQLSNTP